MEKGENFIEKSKDHWMQVAPDALLPLPCQMPVSEIIQINQRKIQNQDQIKNPLNGFTQKRPYGRLQELASAHLD